MKTIFINANGIPQFINAIEAAQQKSKQGNFFIQDDYMHDVDLKLLLQSREYENNKRGWLKLLYDQKTWTSWKTTFRETYVSKRRAEVAWEREDKPFGGSAVNNTHGQLSRRGHKASSVPDPLSNKMPDSLDGCLNNINAAATQTVAKGGPFTELSVSLMISFDTVAKQKQEIKCMCEQINDMKNRGIQASNIGITEGGGLTGNMFPHCSAVGRTVQHKNNSCYFDAKRITDRRG